MAVTHLSGLEVAGVPIINSGGAPFFDGSWFFADAGSGNDGNTGAADNPLGSIYQAQAKAVAGNNDVCVLVGDGSTAATQRLSLANAVAVNGSAITAGTLVWNKSATHLIGMTAPTYNARARFAPPTGTYTQATFGSGNLVTVSGAGCYFGNFSLFHGFSTGGNSQICWTDTGGRNYYYGITFGGAGDAASAQSTTSRSLLISGSGENTFVNCTFGLDTVTRTVANATIEFAGGTARNRFINCTFVFQTSSATVLGIIVAAAAGSDRWQLFDGCTFINNIKSTSTQMTALATLAASMGGLLLFKDCTLVGITEFGSDSTSLGQIYIDGGTVTAATAGIAVNPT